MSEETKFMALEFDFDVYIHYAPLQVLFLDQTTHTYCRRVVHNYNILGRTNHWFALHKRQQPQCPTCRAAVMETEQ